MKEKRKTKGLGVYGYKLGLIFIGTLMIESLGIKAIGSTNENTSSLNWENYDDFSDNSIDSAKWETGYWQGGQAPNETNGNIKLSVSSTNSGTKHLVSFTQLFATGFPSNGTNHSFLGFEQSGLRGVEAELSLPVSNTYGSGVYLGIFEKIGNDSFAFIGPELGLWGDTPTLSFENSVYVNGNETVDEDSDRPAVLGQSYRVAIILNDQGKYELYLNDELITQYQARGSDIFFHFGAFHDQDLPMTAYVDNVRVLRSGQGSGSEEDDEKELSEFYKKLTDEVAKEENDSRASLLKGIHSLLQIFESKEVNGLKDVAVQLGVESSVREFTLAGLPLEEDYAFDLNRNFNSAKFAELFEDGIIPALKETDAHFARIPVTSMITLEPEFTGAEETITVDYADVLVLRSMVKILSALASMQTAYDWGLNAGFVDDQGEENANSTMQTFRAHNPNLLGIRDKEQLAKARQFLEDGIALYQIASPILTYGSRLGRDDQPYPDRLFVLESDSLEDEREFREDLDDLLEALYDPYQLDSDDDGSSGRVSPQAGYHFEERDLNEHIGIIDLNSFFEGKVDLAQLLPDSTGDQFDNYQFKDPTFGGLFPRLNPKRLATILFEEDLIVGQKPHPHDTLSEALAHFDSNAYLSQNQDLQAQYANDASGALEHFKNSGFHEQRRYFFWPFESVDFPISLTEPTEVNGQVVLLNGRLLSAGGSNSVRVGFVISSEGLLPRYDLGWGVHQAALNAQNGFSLAYQPMKDNTTYYYRAYAENEAGRWFGSVKRFKSVEAQADQNSLFGQARSLGNGWYESPWFGIFNLPAQGWSYHLDLGWVYLQEQEDGLWIWSQLRQGWIWTRSDVWPHFWEHNKASWLYFKKIDNQPRFFNFTTGAYE